MRNRFPVLILVVVILAAGPGARLRAQSASVQIKNDPEVKAALGLLEAQLAAFRQEEEIPALSAAVVYDQQILWAKGFGYTDLEGKVPATPQTIYRIASITKLFTATMLMQLRDQGRLQLDDPLGKYLPGFQLKSSFGDLPPVTLRQLASHTAGVPRLGPPNLPPTAAVPPIETILARLQDAEMTFPPLTEYKYSDLGFNLLGHALSGVAGQAYEDYIQDHILKPLGMEHSGFEWTSGMQPHAATAYLRNKGEKLEKYAPPGRRSAFAPCCGLFSSVEDMARFISLQFRDENQPADGAQVLRGSSVREMRTVQWVRSDRLGQGIGFGIPRVGEYVAVGHGGGLRTRVLVVPALKVGVAVFTNGPRGGAAPAASLKALELMIPVIEHAARRQKQVEPATPTAVLQKYVGLYETASGSQAEIKLVKDQLMLVHPQAPEYDTELIPVDEHKFRIKGGYFMGEFVVLESDAGGTVTRLRHPNYIANRK